MTNPFLSRDAIMTGRRDWQKCHAKASAYRRDGLFLTTSHHSLPLDGGAVRINPGLKSRALCMSFGNLNDAAALCKEKW
jgi:hypothetical protein